MTSSLIQNKPPTKFKIFVIDPGILVKKLIHNTKVQNNTTYRKFKKYTHDFLLFQLKTKR